MRSCPRGLRRSVDRGAHRPAIEPRKSLILGADAVQIAEGNTSRRVIASAKTTRRGLGIFFVRGLRLRSSAVDVICRSREVTAVDVSQGSGELATKLPACGDPEWLSCAIHVGDMISLTKP